MPTRVFRIRHEPLLDIVSYGRGRPRENGGRLTAEQVEYVRRTVQRAPEVMVKVLPRASNDLKAAGKHIDYISRSGKLDLETDDDGRLEGRTGKVLLEDWDLDVDDVRRQTNLVGTNARRPPKLVHKLMFSMPPGTPPDKVVAAVRNFAREEFWGQHRYAFVLHTDEHHPHVHLVLKAVSEQGVRLNIRKATLRHWRYEFARNLRLLGVAANATERAVRGETRTSRKDGIYRASLRGDSTYVRELAQAVASDAPRRGIREGAAKQNLSETRRHVVRGWLAVADQLSRSAQDGLAASVQRFVDQMPSAQTDRERLVEQMRADGRQQLGINRNARLR